MEWHEAKPPVSRHSSLVMILSMGPENSEFTGKGALSPWMVLSFSLFLRLVDTFLRYVDVFDQITPVLV